MTLRATPSIIYAYQLRRWFSWCDTNGMDPLLGLQRAHLELYIRHLHDAGLRDSSINTMLHGVRGFFRFAHIDGRIAADPAVYGRLPKINSDETRTQGLDRLELIRFLQVAQTLTVHHGALAYLLGINALRASEAAAVRIEDYAETLRGHRVLHLVGKGSKPATMPITVPVLRVLEACRGQRTEEPRCRFLGPISHGWSGSAVAVPRADVGRRLPLDDADDQDDGDRRDEPDRDHEEASERDGLPTARTAKLGPGGEVVDALGAQCPVLERA